jgi:hypothetical protein
MAKRDAATPTTPDTTEETTMMKAMHTTRTRRLRTGRLVALAAVVALLLALATAAALRQVRTASPVSHTPVAAPALAHDGYAPTGLDYREDHRAAAPAPDSGTVTYPLAFGPGSLDFLENHRTAPRPAARTLPDVPPCLSGGSAVCGPPAPGDDAPAGATPPAPAPDQAPNAPHFVP